MAVHQSRSNSSVLRVSLAFALGLTALIILCRFCRPIADGYAQYIYPGISVLLSLISSPTRVSIQGICVTAIIIVFFVLIVLARRRHWGFKMWFARSANLLLWTYVWFYLGWCLNYSRSSIFQRLEVESVPYDSVSFDAFLSDFTDRLNSSYVAQSDVPEEVLENEIKRFYASVPAQYGLCMPRSWQHPKRMLNERYYSATGILGFMGPLFGEFHLNGKLLPVQKPFTYAHEYSHLLGVSSEAEANWWAWNVCNSSSVPAIRYSAELTMLSYVRSNAARVLSPEQFDEWQASIAPEVLNDYRAKNEYWKEFRNPTLDKLQEVVYDLFLKGNNIPSGTQNYSEVVQMMISLGQITILRWSEQ